MDDFHITCSVCYSIIEDTSVFTITVPIIDDNLNNALKTYCLYNQQKYINLSIENYNMFPNKNKIVSIAKARAFWSILRNNGWSTENVS